MKTIWNQVSVVLMVLLAGLVGLSALPAQAAAGTGVVNINTASVKQLQYLKGIGAKKAQAIIDLRGQQPFSTVEELTKVKGIGKKLVERLRPLLSVQGETTLKAPARKKRSRRKGS